MVQTIGAAQVRSAIDVIPHTRRDIVEDLWAAGYTIARRQRDPYGVDPKAIPKGMAYEWRTKPQRRDNQWRMALLQDDWEFVPASRHDGVYAPVGYRDIIEIGESVLMERPKEKSDKVHAAHEAKAHQNVTDWIERVGASGFSGGVRVWTGDPKGHIPFDRMVGNPTLAQSVIDKTPQALVNAPPPPTPSPKTRTPRHPALRWLFNLISVEK